MKIELHINGYLQIQLTPETPLERSIIDEMLAHAEKGKAVRLEKQPAMGDGTRVGVCAVVSVEK